MRTDYENTVYTIGALTVLIERDDTPEPSRSVLLAKRAELLARVPRLLDEMHRDYAPRVSVVVVQIGASR